MLRLVYKDIRLLLGTRMILVISGVMCLAAAVTLSTNATFGYFASIMTAYMMVNYLNSYDFRYKTEVLFRSLPVSTEWLVASRYISTPLFLLVPLCAVVLLRLALAAAGMFPLRELMTAEYAVQVLGVGLLYFAIFLPLYYKLGYVKCRWITIVGMGLAFGIPLSLVKIAEEMFSKGSLAHPEEWHETAQEALALMTGVPVWIWNIVYLCFAGAALGVSFLIARRLYAKRDCSF